MRHTPGPWYADFAHIASAENIVVAVAIRGRIDDDPGVISMESYNANIRLIAAAPELLAALVAMRAEFTSNGTDGQHNACRMADAAIAKAEGRGE